MRLRRLLFLIICITAFISISTTDRADAQKTKIRYADNKIAIKLHRAPLAETDESLFTDGLIGVGAIDSLNLQYNVSRVSRFFPNSQNKGTPDKPVTLDAWFKLHFRDSVDVRSIAGAYGALSATIVAEAIPIVPIYRTPDDPDYSTQWHLNQANDADIDAPEAWDIDDGSEDVIVAILDTGVRWYHKDLAGAQADTTDRTTINGNIWVNSNEIANTDTSVDEDGNGYKDDWVGWDFVNVTPIIDLGDDYSRPDNDPRDFDGHRTHCAGNVGAVNNNSRGVCAATGGWNEDPQGEGNGAQVMCLRIGWNDGLGRVSMDFAAESFKLRSR